MASKKVATSQPAKAGEEETKSTECCIRHEGVTLCGAPDDVKKVLSVLQQQEAEQLTGTPSDDAVIATGPEEEVSEPGDSSALSENSEVADVETPDDYEDDDCPCWEPGDGRKRRIVE